jgi:tRNA-binding protein
MPIKPQVDFETFLSLDIRAGKVLKVEDSLATKPTYRFTVDFGSEIGEKVTVAAMTHYTKEELVGLTILGLVNVGSRKMGPEKSEFLFLGAPNEEDNAVPLTTYKDIKLGGGVY